jgi:hypothetical protein
MNVHDIIAATSANNNLDSIAHRTNGLVTILIEKSTCGTPPTWHLLNFAYVALVRFSFAYVTLVKPYKGSKQKNGMSTLNRCLYMLILLAL